MSTTRFSSCIPAEHDALFHKAVEDKDLPFVVAIVTNPERILYQVAIGAEMDAIFEIASLTKPVTSIAIMMLEERGLLALDDPVERFIPELANRVVFETFNYDDCTFTTQPATQQVTIRHLLSHTAGYGYAFSNDIVHTLAAHGKWWHYELPDLPLLHDPGSRWTYGGSTAILGKVIERITGKPFYVFLNTEILYPLGMQDTDVFVPLEKQNRFAPHYKRIDGELVYNPRPDPHVPYVVADGALNGTAPDYVRLLQMLLNKGHLEGLQLLSEQSIEEMTRNQIGELCVQEQAYPRPGMSRPFPKGAGADKFGLGFQIRTLENENERSIGSYSWSGLHNTHFWVDPVMQLGVVMFTQLMPFYDERCMKVLIDFEHSIYRHCRRR